MNTFNYFLNDPLFEASICANLISNYYS